MTTAIAQQYLSCRFEVLVNFGQVFAIFFGASIVGIEFSLFIMNVIRRYLNNNNNNNNNNDNSNNNSFILGNNVQLKLIRNNKNTTLTHKQIC